MRNGKFIVLMLLVLAGCVSGLQLDPKRYPAAARGTTVDDYHGTRVADPYRWMEDTASPATQQFVAAENSLTRPYLDALPRLKAIRARLDQLYHYERQGVPEREGGRYFYMRNDGKQDQAVLMVSANAAEFAAGQGRELINPNVLRGDATVSLADYVPSPDGRWLAYSISDAGSDWNTWHVMDVETGKDQPEVLRDTKFTRASWVHDGSGFYYSAYPGGDDKLQAVVRWHRVGDPQSKDREVFAVRDHSTRVPYGEVSEDGRYLVITLDEGTLSNGIMVMPLAGGAAQPVFMQSDGKYSYLGSRTAVGTELLFRTTAGAPNGRVVALDLGKFDAGKPGAQQVRVVVPESTNALEASSLVGDKVIAAYLQDAHSTVKLFDAGSGRATGEVKLPGPGAVEGFTGRPGDTESFYSFMDFSAPRRIFRLDMASGESTLLRQPRFAADTSPYVTEQVFYPEQGWHADPDVHRAPQGHEARWHQPGVAVWLWRLRRLHHPLVLGTHRGVAGNGRRVRRCQPARRRRVRRAVAQGRRARQEAERLRRFHRRRAVPGARTLHLVASHRDQWREQRRPAGGRHADPAPGCVWRGACRRGRHGHAALPPGQRQRAPVVGRLWPVG